MKHLAVVFAALLTLPPTLLAGECESLIQTLDTSINGKELDADLQTYLDDLRTEASTHLENGDAEACEAAIRQALELLEVT